MNRRRMTQHVDVPEFPNQPAFIESPGCFAEAENRFLLREFKGQLATLGGETGCFGHRREKFVTDAIAQLPAAIRQTQLEDSGRSFESDLARVPSDLNFGAWPVRFANGP